MVQYTEFDVAEMSTSTYMNLLARGDDRYIAIPVFLSRHFRHATSVNTAADIHEPGDLRGRRAGILEYQMTAALGSARCSSTSMAWLPPTCSGSRGHCIHQRRGAEPYYGAARYHAPPPPAGEYLETMLAEGELDVLFSAVRPPALTDGSGRVRRLFPDYVTAEQEFYGADLIFPIMHLVVLRRALYAEHPWIASNLLVAFREGPSQLGWQRLQDTGTLAVMLPWLAAELERIATVMGPSSPALRFRGELRDAERDVPVPP